MSVCYVLQQWDCVMFYPDCDPTMVRCYGYHGLDALWKEEAIVEGVHRVVGFHRTLSLEQDGTGVQTIISPEDGEPSLLIPLDQSPENTGPGQTQNQRQA